MLCSNLSLDLRKIIMSIVSSAILHLRAVDSCAAACIETISLSRWGGGVMGGVILPPNSDKPPSSLFLAYFCTFPPLPPYPTLHYVPSPCPSTSIFFFFLWLLLEILDTPLIEAQCRSINDQLVGECCHFLNDFFFVDFLILFFK